MASVLIIDLDGVVRNWDAGVARAAEQRHGLPAGCIQQEAFAGAALAAAITGEVTDEQWRSGIAASLAGAYGPGAVRAVEEWSESCGSVNLAVLDLVRQQRRIRRVALLSNATTRLADDLARLGLDKEFDAVFNSSTLGSAKPDEETFRAVLDALGASPSDCLFVDDTEGHVAAAAALGLHAHQFQSETELEAFLLRHSVPPSAQ
jgi:putative hydrolase of the HAD superfamily